MEANITSHTGSKVAYMAGIGKGESAQKNMVARTERADLFIVCYRSACTSVADLQTIYRSSTDYLQIICRMSAECLQSICSDDLQQVCKFADALQTKSAYHAKQKAHKMHQSNNVYLKDRQRRSVCYSSNVNN